LAVAADGDPRKPIFCAAFSGFLAAFSKFVTCVHKRSYGNFSEITALLSLSLSPYYYPRVRARVRGVAFFGRLSLFVGMETVATTGIKLASTAMGGTRFFTHRAKGNHATRSGLTA